MEDAAAVPVNQGGSHADIIPADAKQLRHGVTLTACIVVLMQFITKNCIDLSAHFPFDVGAQRKPALCSPHRIALLRECGNLGKLIQYRLVLGAHEMLACPVTVDPAILWDLDPVDLPPRDYRCPENCAATAAFVVPFVLLLKEKLVGVDRVPGAILADLHFNRFHAVWTEKRFFSAIPLNSGIAHIAVPGALLAEHRKNTLRTVLVHIIKPVEVCDAFYHHGKGVGQSLADLTHPLLCDM